MWWYILPLPADTSAVQQGIFVTCSLCQIQSHTKHSRPRTTLKTKAKDLDCKAKDKNFGLKDQGQGLTLVNNVMCSNFFAFSCFFVNTLNFHKAFDVECRHYGCEILTVLQLLLF